jgi:hypothetical protein
MGHVWTELPTASAVGRPRRGNGGGDGPGIVIGIENWSSRSQNLQQGGSGRSLRGGGDSAGDRDNRAVGCRDPPYVALDGPRAIPSDGGQNFRSCSQRMDEG